jgi:uncharacterized membrane protein YoaK (UPF0700 family)
MRKDREMIYVQSPSIDRGPVFHRWEKLLLFLLSVISGVVDVISFLTLKIFAAHITGNLVLIAAAVAGGNNPRSDQVLAIPVFMTATAAAWLIVKTSGLQGLRLAQLLLAAQFVLLTAVFVIAIGYRPSVNPRGPMFTAAAMTAVAAIAFQFAFLRVIMPKAPPTSVMTGHLSSFTLALSDCVAGEGLPEGATQRLRNPFFLLFGFLGGCAAGAGAVLFFGDWSWLLAVVLAAIAIVVVPDGGKQA